MSRFAFLAYALRAPRGLCLELSRTSCAQFSKLDANPIKTPTAALTAAQATKSPMSPDSDPSPAPQEPPVAPAETVRR